VVESLARGQAVTLAVRPERMRLETRAVPEPDNTIEGWLEDIIFIGSDLLYIVRLKNQAKVTVRQPNQAPLHSAIPYQIGQAVLVSWSPDSTHVLTE
jgi:ABC-type Fe3+/spermidine/putrescine transport system ATPase subunit